MDFRGNKHPLFCPAVVKIKHQSPETFFFGPLGLLFCNKKFYMFCGFSENRDKQHDPGENIQAVTSKQSKPVKIRSYQIQKKMSFNRKNATKCSQQTILKLQLNAVHFAV